MPLDRTSLRRLAVALGSLAAVALAGVPDALHAQVDIPLLVHDEVTALDVDDVRTRLGAPVDTRTLQSLLAEVGLEINGRPVRFTLTPRDAYRRPGGVIRLISESGTTGDAWWQPASPEPTGSAGMDTSSRIFVHLLDLEPNYRYAVDIWTDTHRATDLQFAECRRYARPFESVRVVGPKHTIMVLRTDHAGNACLNLSSSSDQMIYLHRVDITRVGPITDPLDAIKRRNLP